MIIGTSNATLEVPLLRTWEELHQKFVVVTIDKASNNFALICRKYYIPKRLADVSPNKNEKFNINIFTNTKVKEIIKTNIKYWKKFDLKVIKQDKTLPIMYWLPNMHKTPTGARFILASKNCSTTPLSDGISKVFKMVFNHVESFHRKSLFYTFFKKFWEVENLFAIATKLNKINTKKKAKKYFNFRL